MVLTALGAKALSNSLVGGRDVNVAPQLVRGTR